MCFPISWWRTCILVDLNLVWARRFSSSSSLRGASWRPWTKYCIWLYAEMNPHLSLGYCCLNTRLHSEGIFCARVCRLASFKAKGLRFAQELSLHNLRDVLPILKWNSENDIKVFRLSSDIFPLASHPDCLYSMDFAQELMTQIGETARNYGQRLTLHPSQHHVLTAKAEKVNTSNSPQICIFSKFFDSIKHLL